MKQRVLRHAKAQAQEIKNITKSRAWQLVFGIGFLLGFVIFALLGKEFAAENELLDVESLRSIKDAVLEKKDVLSYVFWQRMAWMLLGFFAWWWGYGKWYIYGILGYCGLAMGACLQTAVLRYGIKGLVLWCVLYFPQAFFYAGALGLCMILCEASHKDNVEKIRFLLQKSLTVLGFLVLYGLGIYCQGCVNVSLLQNYLQFF